MPDRNSIALAPLAGVLVLALVSAIVFQLAGSVPPPATRAIAPRTATRALARAVTVAPALPTAALVTPTTAPTAEPQVIASPIVPVTSSEPASTAPISVTVTNRACLIQEYAIDDAVKVTLAPGETKTISSRTGQHSVRVCFPGSGDCTDRTDLVWTEAVSVSINACPDSIAVKVTNEDCEPQRYFVDAQLVAPYLVQGADTTFQTNPGYHKIHTCNIETGDCSEDVLVIWADATETLIAPSGRCGKQ